jgi:glycosyltransferase involved in cell wall biosynthesis
MNDICELTSATADHSQTAISFAAAQTAIFDTTLDAVFRRSEKIEDSNPWWPNVPFAYWIVSTLRPRLIVEYGHTGLAFLAFCRAVQSAGVAARCVAIDPAVDDFMERDGGNFDKACNDYRETHFSEFSTRLQGTVNDGLSHLEDCSIDILHIDARQTYEASRALYDSFRPKLSSRAVILIHDINDRPRNFGGWRLWNDLGKPHPAFQFSQGRGIGALVLGSDGTDELLALSKIQDGTEVAAIRAAFSRMGDDWLTAIYDRLSGRITAPLPAPPSATDRNAPPPMTAQSAALTEIGGDLAAAYAQLEAEKAEFAITVAEAKRLRNEQEKADARRRDLAAQRTVAARKQAIAAADIARQSQSELATLRESLAREAADQPKLEPEIVPTATETLQISAVQAGPSVTAGGRLPRSIRRAIRGVAKLTWWTVTLRLSSKLEERRQLIARDEGLARSAQQPLPSSVATQLPSVSRADHPTGLSIAYISGEPNTPGHLYRIERYRAALGELGGKSTSMRVDEIPSRISEIETANILVIWRAPWDDNVEAAIVAARKHGVRIVFDVDDLMIDANLARLDVIDGIRSQFLLEDQVRDHYNRVRRTMLAADICFTTTEELAFHMRWARKTTHVLPNGFDQETHDFSRYAMRDWRRSRTDSLIRIGYAGGSRTHQRDFGLAVEAVARLLRENVNCRLVLFRTPDGVMQLIDVAEYPVLAGLEDRIEWRPLQPLTNLPAELARLDINLAPLEFGNPFCEAKSELKFFEAALVDVPTVASPTGPFRRAIEHGKTGFLAATADDWYVHLKALAEDPDLRRYIAHNAYHAALGVWGPMYRKIRFARVLDQVLGGVAGAHAFALEAQLARQPWKAPKVFGSDVVMEYDTNGHAEVTVIIPLHNYENYIVETLESVRDQTLDPIDLVIVDDDSTDNSLAVATSWAEKNAARFNRIVVLKNRANYGLAYSRNAGFDAARSAYVMPLDADNLLAPACCESLLETIQRSAAAYAYPTIQHFGSSSALLSDMPYDPQTLAAGNFIDAMALVSREAWAMIGGYDHIRHGWEDFDFWCRLAEKGLRGEWRPEILAYYRVHQTSMLATQTVVPENYRRLMANFKAAHPWVSLIDQETSRRMPPAKPALTADAAETRLDRLLPILRCPISGQRLAYNADRTALLSVDGLYSWPLCNDRAVLVQGVTQPECHPDDHISNELPEVALDLIRKTDGMVLNLSAGGSRLKFDHVVEVEYAIFRHTDIVADSHNLPFLDETFEAIVVMNAFEHYRQPHSVASELLRILKPGGKVLIRTAFLQPLHERPWHFFNCTQYGLSEWFKGFDTEQLHVSENFCPNHSISWLASEAETALRNEVSAESADRFKATPIGELIELWRDPGKRDTSLWTDFEKISQATQEVTAAGFEYLGRRPPNLPDLTGSRNPSA